MPVIKPTPGRVVWYFPDQDDKIIRNGSEPLAAIIACVCTDRFVHLAVFDANGHSESRTGIVLLQEGETAPSRGPHCAWMPYQLGQAKKAEPPAVVVNHVIGAPAPIS